MSNQLTEQKYTCRDEQRNEIHKALIKEYEALSNKASEQKIKLHNGVLQQALADKYIYKFSLPKEPEKLLEPDKPYILSIDGNTIKGSITAIPQDKSEVEIELYQNFGRLIPSLEIIIDLKVLIDLIDRRIVAIDKEPSKFKTETATFLFNPHRNAQVPILKKKLNHSPRDNGKELTEEQVFAISASLKQKLTIIWGPPGTGKTITLQGIIAELLSNGQKVLFASNTNNAIDELLKGLIDECPYKIFDELKNSSKIVRIGGQTDYKIKSVFGSLAVTQHKSQEIQDEIKALQEKTEIEQKELKIIQDELKQFEYAKYLNDEIVKLTEKQKTIPPNQELQKQIGNITQCKEMIFASIKESENAKDIVLRIESIAEKLKNQKIKVAGINTIVHKINAEIEADENEEIAIVNKIENLKNAFLSILRHKKDIKTLREKQTTIFSKIQEQKYSLETYKKQQASEITSESELTGDFVNVLTELSARVSESKFNINSIQECFVVLNLVLKLEEQKPLWILLGEEYKVITGEKGNKINEFTSIIKVNQDIVTKKYEHLISEIKKQIENNKHLQSLFETKLKMRQKEFAEYKSLFSKSETYWYERKEKVKQIQKIIEPIQAQLNLLNEKLRNIEKNIIKEAKLICCTLVKSSYDETLAECDFDTLVVDETSMVSLPQLYCTSVLIKERIILCGDHLQLQPISTSESKIALKWLASSYYDFIEYNGELEEEQDDNDDENDSENKKKKRGKRCIKRARILEKLKEHLSKLTLQHRMPEAISDLVKPWYSKNSLKLEDKWNDPSEVKEFKLNGHFLSDTNNIYFIDTSSIRTYHNRTSDKSPYNLINAAIVAEITRELVENYKIGLKNIRCITPYRAQYQLTSALLSKFLPDELKEKLPNVASSVHKMQGGEAPIIFYDLTDGCQGGFTGFLKTEDFHIHNVAISRSQFKLIFVGDLKKIQKLREANPKAAFNDILPLLNSAKVIDAKPIKEKIFKQFNEKDLINENTFFLTEEQRNSLIILPSQLYYRFLENDISNAEHSILLISPFVTKTRWNKLKETLLNFKNNTDGVITIITKPPDKMFGDDQINMSAVEVLNEFIKQGFIVRVSPKIHSKLVVIDRGTDNAIAYWGSLNPLSFNDTDEINTRLAGKEIAEQLINMSSIGNIYPYKEGHLNKELLPEHTKETVRKQFNNFRWTLAGFYSRPVGAICSNDTIEKIIKYLPTNRNEYNLIPQFNRKNFVLWNHLDEIEEIIALLREYQNTQVVNSQIDLFNI